MIQKSRTVINECTDALQEKRRMLKTWCTHERIRIGQCDDEVYVCLCSSPGDFSESEQLILESIENDVAAEKWTISPVQKLTKIECCRDSVMSTTMPRV